MVNNISLANSNVLGIIQNASNKCLQMLVADTINKVTQKFHHVYVITTSSTYKL